MKKIVTLLLVLLAGFSGKAQLYINEISQGPSGSKEYMEFVVVGTRTCTDSTLDIRGMIFDDNPGWYGLQAFNAGCMRFANTANWSAVPYGSIILVYNTADKNALITQPDDPTDANGDHVYIVPSSSSQLQINNAQPAATSASFNYASAVSSTWSAPNGASWTNALALGNGVDAVHIIDPNVSTTSAVHSVGYGTLNSPGAVDIYLATAGSATNYYNNGASPMAQTSWATGTAPGDETPGVPNSAANTIWINAMRMQVTGTNPGIITNVSGPATLCTGTSGTYTATAITGATSYVWTLPSGLTGTSATNSITITAAGGTGGSISVYAVTPCGNTQTINYVVSVASSVTPSVTITAAPSGSICANTSVLFTAMPVNGGISPSYAWTRNGNPVGNNSNTYTGTGWTNGDQVRVTLTSNAACATTTTAQSNIITLNVTAAPAAISAITGAATVCAGNAQTYSVTPVSGATTYTWTLPSGWSGTSITNSITATPNGNGGTISVVAGNSCGTVTATLAVTAGAAPTTPATVSGNVAVCPGGSYTYIAAPVSGATSYNWTFPAGWVITAGATTNTVTVTAGTTGNTIQVTASNACGTSAVASFPVSVNQAVTPSVSIAAAPGNVVCAGSMVTFTATPVNGGATPVYQWKKNNANVGTNSNQYTDNALVSGDQITVTLTSNAGCITTPTAGSNVITMTVNPQPPVPGAISGPVTVCPGSGNIYTVSLLPSAISYNWTLPAGWVGVASANSITATAGSTGGTISVTTTNSCGTSAPATLAVVVTANTTPAVSISASTPTAICSGTAVTFTATPTNGGTTPTYQWRRNGNNITGATGATYSTSTLANGDMISVVMTTSSACSTTPTATSQNLTFTVNSIPAAPSGINTASTTVCSGAVFNLNANGPAGAGNFYYSWTLPSGWVINTANADSSALTVTPGATNGTVTLKATSAFGCGSSSTVSLAMTVATTPATPGGITGPVNPCVGAGVQYSVAAVNGATSYIWTIPATWSGSSTSSFLNVTAGNASGNITVSASNLCGTSAPATLAVAPVNVPPAPGAITGNAAPCSGTQQTYTVPAVSGITYTWTNTAGWAGTSNTNNITYTTTANAGTITVYAVGVCGTSNPTSLTVQPGTSATPTATISTATTTICAGAAIQFTASVTNAGANPVYQWRKNNNNVGINAPTYSDNALNTGDNISVQVTASNPCASVPVVTSNSLIMTVSPAVIPGINVNIFPGTTVCAGTALTFVTNIVGGGTAPSYQWYQNNVLIPGATGPNYTSANINNGDTIYVVLRSNATCPTVAAMPSNKAGVKIDPIITPQIFASSSLPMPIPAGASVTFTAAYTGGGSTPALQWIKNGTDIPNETGNTYTTSNLQHGDLISVRMLSSAACAAPRVVTAPTINVRRQDAQSVGTVGNWSGELTLFPNPSSGHFTIRAEWGTAHAGDRVHIELINTLGQSVYRSSLVPGRSTWSTDVWIQEGVANGMYQLRVYTENMQAVRPVLLQR